MINILVTGAGGGVGQGIIKSLKMINDLEIKIVTADMSALAVGLYAGDIAYLVEGCYSLNYMESLETIFKIESIDYYFPGTDVELSFCAEHKKLFRKEYGVKTVISSLTAVEIADDKYKTYQFLKNNGFTYPKTEWLVDAIESNNLDFPLIVKPAVGCRSIGVSKVSNYAELSKYESESNEIVVQECVGSDDSEYTCTVVKVNDELSPVLALRRVLRSGDTYRAEPVKSDDIEAYVQKVASVLDIDGACNFQLRLDGRGIPKIFEINCRYSGTTPFCSQLGFNPVEYYIKRHLKLDYDFQVNYNSIVLRYWSEVVVNKDELKIVSEVCGKVPSLDGQFNLFSGSGA